MVWYSYLKTMFSIYHEIRPHFRGVVKNLKLWLQVVTSTVSLWIQILSINLIFLKNCWFDMVFLKKPTGPTLTTPLFSGWDFYFYTVIKKLQTQEVSLRSKENKGKAENAFYLMPTLWAYESKYQSNRVYCAKKTDLEKHLFCIVFTNFGVHNI